MSAAIIEKLRNDPIYFADKVLDVQLHEGQKRILQCKDRFIAVRAARRFGKSYVFACFAAWAACTHQDYHVVCISKSQRQSSLMFQTIYKLISRSSMANSITRDTQTRIEFTNGSVIESLPGGSYDSIRGITIDLILIDEAAYVPEELFVVLYPTIITTKGTVVLISTPAFSTGEFYRACTDPKSEYTTFHMTHDDAVFDDGSPFVDRDELAREIQRCGGENSSQYIREYLADFTDAEGAFFNLNSVNSALTSDIDWLEVGIPDRKYVVGAGLAKEQDYTVIIVLDITDEDRMKIVHHRRFNGLPPAEVGRILYEICMRFNVATPHIDSTGIGGPILDMLNRSYPRIRWQGINLNTKSKPELMTDLSIALDRGHLQIPDDDEIRKELLSFQYKTSEKSGHISMYGVGAHDDYPIAIALALRASGKMKRNGSLAIATNKGFLKRKQPAPLTAGNGRRRAFT